MVAADFSDYLKFILTDPRYSGTNSFYTATDALLTLEAEIVKQEELPTEGAERTPEQIERLPVLEMLRKYGLGEKREHLLLAGKPGSGKSTTLRRLCVELAEIALGDELQPIPVFVQLKGDKPLLTIIQAEFRRAKLKVTEEQIDDLLLADKLVLLLDGVNEIPSEQLRRELQDFRENNLTTPTIFTTRDLTVGGSLGIDKRLEMRPLTNEQMQEFVHKYLPEYGDKLLGQLRDRLREIAETPLLLKMLCEVFDPTTGQIPQNKGELFELFDRKYQCHKEGVAVSDDFRRFQSEVLQYLGFTMLQGDAQKPTEAWLTLPRQQAEGVLETWLQQRGETNPASKAKEWLEDLVELHLLQVAADPKKIEFHHQLFQEYYAARHLQAMLQDRHPDLVDDQQLKHFYLNYLKWTEPLSLLLGLLDDEQALRLVRLGLDVDWFLGARLAGEAKQEFQQQTVGLVSRLVEEKDLQQWLKFELWEKTRSSTIIPKLLPILQDSDSWMVQLKVIKVIGQLGDISNISNLSSLLQDCDHWVRPNVLAAIKKLGDKEYFTDLLFLLQHINSNFRWIATKVILELGNKNDLSLRHDSNPSIQESVVNAILKLGDKNNLPDLLLLLQDSDSNVRKSVVNTILKLGNKSDLPDLLPLLQDSDSNVRKSVVNAILNLGNKSDLPDLLPLLQDSDSNVRKSVVNAILKLGDKSNLPDLLLLLQDSDSHIRKSVVNAILKLGDKSNLPDLLLLLQDSDSHIRKSVVDTILKLGNKSNLPDLLPLLQHSDPIIQSCALEAILKLGDKSNLPDLLPLLQHPASIVRSCALEAILELGDKSNLPDLLPLLQDSHSYIQGRALEAILELGDKSNLPDLLPLLQDSHSCIHGKAEQVVLELDNKNNLPDLLPLLQDSHSDVRASTLEAILKLGDKSNLPDLLPLLQDSYSYIRYLTIEVILELGDKSNLPDLLPLLQDSNSDVRLSALEATLKLRDKNNSPDLLPLLQDSSSNVRLRTVRAIGQSVDKSNLHDLLPLLQDSSSDVRLGVVRAIRQLVDKSNLHDLLPLLQDSNSDVRSTAVEMIGQLGGEKAVIVLTDILNIRGANMRKLAAKTLGKIQEWEDLSPLTQSLTIIALLNSLETHHDSIRSTASESLSRIGNFKILPLLHQKLTESKNDKITKIIFAIQAKCEFYNYDIFRIPPDNQQSSPPSLTLNIDKLGNLNTGTVNVQGNQIGIQQPADPQ
jgi:HEAT repeat protein